jgi:hypothetical protein
LTNHRHVKESVKAPPISGAVTVAMAYVPVNELEGEVKSKVNKAELWSNVPIGLKQLPVQILNLTYR